LAVADLEEWLAENYEQIVADGGNTFEGIAELGELSGPPSLAAWARKRASESGRSVVPVNARAVLPSTKRADTK